MEIDKLLYAAGRQQNGGSLSLSERVIDTRLR